MTKYFLYQKYNQYVFVLWITQKVFQKIFQQHSRWNEEVAAQSHNNPLY